MGRISVVVAAPIRDRAWILPTWLAHLARAAKRAAEDGIDVSFIFLENDSVDATPQMLCSFASLFPTILLKKDYGYHHYKVPFANREQGEKANAHNDKRELAEMRNMIVEAFLGQTNARYLVMWDSDVIMPSEALSGDPRSLVSVMERLPEVETMCADVQHPHCGGRYHNYMLEVAPGRYNHPDRSRPIPQEWIIDQFVVMGSYLVRPDRTVPKRWCDLDRDTDMATVVRVGTTGGGGAAITRREVLENHGVRYGPHPQGEDIALCEAIRDAGYAVAMYSGIRGLHVPRDLYPGEFDLDSLYGIWIKNWLREEAWKRKEKSLNR